MSQQPGAPRDRGWTVFAEGLRGPVALALDRQGNLYVADSGNNRVLQLTPTGQPIRVWGLARGRGTLRFPTGVAVDGQGRLYVADTSNERVAVFAPTGELLASWELLGRVAKWFAMNFLPLGGHAYPHGVAIAPDGRIVVAITGQGCLGVFTPAGERLATWGSYGEAPGQFRSPVALAFDAAGCLYVADARNHRLQKFAPDGRLLRAWGEYGWRPGQFNAPAGLAISAAGDLYVADSQNHRVQQLAPDGEPLQTWGAVRVGRDGHSVRPVEGRGVGEFIHPQGVAVDARGTLYVADAHAGRIQRLASGMGGGR